MGNWSSLGLCINPLCISYEEKLRACDSSQIRMCAQLLSSEDVQLQISSAGCYSALPTPDLDAVYASLALFPDLSGLWFRCDDPPLVPDKLSFILRSSLRPVLQDEGPSSIKEI